MEATFEWMRSARSDAERLIILEGLAPELNVIAQYMDDNVLYGATVDGGKFGYRLSQCN